MEKEKENTQTYRSLTSKIDIADVEKYKWWQFEITPTLEYKFC